MKRTFLLILFLKITIGYAQIDTYYGGCGNEWASDFILNGSEVNILGVSSSFDWGEGDIYNISIDTNGNLRWAKTYRIDHNNETPTKLYYWHDNMIHILGGLGNGFHYPYLMTVDSTGHVLWTMENELFRFRDMIKSRSKQKLIACGDFNSNGNFPPAILVRDSTGYWSRFTYYSFTPDDPITSEGFYTDVIIQDHESNYIISGHGFAHEPGQPGWTVDNVLFVMKLDEELNILWSRVLDFESVDVANIINTPGNEYLIAGHSHHNSFITKVDSDGNLIFLKQYSLDNDVVDFIETSTNEYLLLTQNATLMKLDEQCDVIWSNQYDSSNVWDAYASSILEINKSYYLLKTSSSNPVSDSLSPPFFKRDILMVKIDTAGNSNVFHTTVYIYSTLISVDTFAYTFNMVDTTSIFNMILVGENNASITFSDSLDCVGVGISNYSQQDPPINLYPNPNQGEFTIYIDDNNVHPINIHIYNMHGMLVYREDAYNGSTKEISLGEGLKGTFIVKISSVSFLKTFKIHCF